MEFIRYGNLIPQQHDRPTNENDYTFHTPPCEYGFYAFPKGFVGPYLLGGIGSGNVRNGRFKFLKDENGNKIYVEFGDFFSEEYNEKTYKNYVKDKWLTLLKKNGLTYNDVVAYVEDEDGVASKGWFEKYEKVNIAILNKPTCFKYNGLIWHSEQYKYNPIMYHLEKTEKCNEQGIRLIHIFEDEWLEKKEIVKSRLSSIIGINSIKIYARKCEIREV